MVVEGEAEGVKVSRKSVVIGKYESEEDEVLS